MAGSTTYTVFLTLLAEQERNDIVEWYAQNNLMVARRWFDEFDQLLERLANNPFLYSEHLLFIRKARMNKFPYHVFYAIDESNFRIEIIGIQHTSRDTDIIRRRINY